MKYKLVLLVIISIFLSSCTSVVTGVKEDPEFVSSIPVQTLEITVPEITDFKPDRISDEFHDSFKQVLRMGNGALNILDYEELYPLPRGTGTVKILSYDANSTPAKKYFDFNIDYNKYNMEIFKTERYDVPQYQYPLAFFDLQYEVKNKLTPSKPYFLHYLSNNTKQTELWLSNASISFAHQIDTLDHVEFFPKPMAYYHNYVDYYHGWLAYLKGNDIHLINLFAELSMVEDKNKVDLIKELLKSKQNAFKLDVGLYKQNQKNRIIPEAFASIFKADAPENMKRLLHLHELKNHILLGYPTQNHDERMYIFDKKFANPPDVLEFERDHYRIYPGSDSENDHPMIMMYDNIAEEIEFYDMLSKKRSSINLKSILAPVDRKIDNLFLTKNKKGYDLHVFPKAFSDVQNHYFLILELDEEMNPVNQIRVKIKTDFFDHYYQAVYRTQEKDFVLLCADKEYDNLYLMRCSLDSKTSKIEAKCYDLDHIPYVLGDLMMLYHPGGFLVLQNTVTNDENNAYKVKVDFYNLKGFDGSTKTNEVK
jgi:hypothetical protein